MKKNIVILDNLRSLNNIGSIFRTCDALNIKKLFLCGICVYIYSVLVIFFVVCEHCRL